jgi:nucleoside-diphosphate-sugar epimerase
MPRILVTGSRGLIGSALLGWMTAAGWDPVGFDVADQRDGISGDIVDADAVAAAVKGCTGVVHLAAVSRVLWGEQDPARCQKVNVEGTRNVLSAARAHGRPWVLIASSREVYGQADSFPVPETATLRPLNTYARSKVAIENMAAAECAAGLPTSIIRFSSVYGSVDDHPDRVAPAFARTAAFGGVLRLDGAETTLDFTHISDVSEGLRAATELLAAGHGPLPTLHLVSGRGTSLGELAQIAIDAAGRGSVKVAPSRPYDVSSFIGDPARAEQVLGWKAKTPLEEGMADLVKQFRQKSA